MANVTIYVREDDIGIFHRAREISDEGSLSGVIARALREYLERREKARLGMEEIEIKVGASGALRKIRFFGRLIARNNPPDIDKRWIGDISSEEWTDEQSKWAHAQEKVFSLYQTCKGRLLMHYYDIYNLTYGYQLFNDYQEFCEQSGVSKGNPIQQVIARNLGEDAVEYLDL